MKKITLMAALTLSVSVFAQKYVLFEHFTSTTCGPCASQNPTFQNGILKNNPNTVRHMAYHVDWPAAGDPMNLANPTEVKTRVTYYGVSGVPYMRMNGKTKYQASPLQYIQPDIDSIVKVASPILIQTTWVKNGSNRDITVTVKTLTTPPSGTFTLRTAIIERAVNYSSAPGSNGEKDFPNVFRKFAQTNTGEAITFAAVGQSVSFNYSIPESSITYKDLNQLAVISFVQNNSTKEVITSGSTFDPTIALSATNAFAVGGTSGNTSSIDISALNASSANDTYDFTLTATAPSGWSANFDLNGQNYTSSATGIAIAQSTTIPGKINVTPGTTAGLGKYVLSAVSQNNPGVTISQTVYVLANVTDLVVSHTALTNKGYINSWESLFTNGLQAAGNTNYAATTIDVMNELYKNSGMGGVKCIYYNAGWAVGIFDDAMVSKFTSHLNAGGRLFVCGQDVGWETWDAAGTGTTNTKAFYTNYLNAAYTGDGASTNTAFNAVTSDAVFGAAGNATITNFYGNDNSGNPLLFPDELNTAGIGVSVFKYANNKTAGVRADNGTYKTVYFGVGLEHFSSAATANNYVKITHNWFWGGVSTAEFDKEMAILGQNYPNPGADVTVIPFNKLDENVNLQIMDVTGRVVYQQQVLKGTEQISIQTSSFDNGLYMYRVINNDGKVSGIRTMDVIH